MRDEIKAKAELVIMDLIDWMKSGYSLSASSSWGKDSLVVTILLVEAVSRMIRNGLTPPPCFVMSANTLVENQELNGYVLAMGSDLTSYCTSHNLPITYVMATPIASETWHYSHLGKGKLFRYPGLTRDCTLDLKIKPMMRLKKQMFTATHRPVVSLVGTRLTESAERAEAMKARGDAPGIINKNKDGDLYATPIADWEVEEIWGLIMYCDQSSPKRIYTSFRHDFEPTLVLYREANGGECVAALGDKELNSSACGARFGCWNCVAAGDKDKSMQSMLANAEYLIPIARLRDWFFAIRWDFTKRRWLGKKKDANGRLAIEPGVFNLETRLQMLKYMLTIDADEREFSHKKGIPPRFTLIPPEELIAIDYRWSIDEESEVGFAAIRQYDAIMNEGKRYYIPDHELVPVPEQPMPPVKWFYHSLLDDEPDNEQLMLDLNLSSFSKKIDIDPNKSISMLDMAAIGSFTKKQSTPAQAVEFYLMSGTVSVSSSQLNYIQKQLIIQSRWSRFKRQFGIFNLNAYVQSMVAEQEQGRVA